MHVTLKENVLNSNWWSVGCEACVVQKHAQKKLMHEWVTRNEMKALQ